MPKHHYLAQCYLKGFAARHYDNAIWQYRKSTRALQLKGIGNVANRPNYYSHEFVAGEFDDHPEQFFSKIESRWPSLRQRLESQKSGILNTIVSPSMASGIRPITDKHRVEILQFMLIHTLRVPGKMEWMRTYASTHHPRRETLTSREIHNLVVAGLENVHDDIVRKWVYPLLDKPLHVAFPPLGSGITILTSDNPVYIKGDIREESTFVLFPISKRMFLQFGGPTVHGDAKHEGWQVQVIMPHDTSVIQEANSALVQMATDEIYASEPNYLKSLLERLNFEVELRHPRVPT